MREERIINGERIRPILNDTYWIGEFGNIYSYSNSKINYRKPKPYKLKQRVGNN